MTSGPVMLDIEGHALTDDDRRRLMHPQTGGVVLFTRNYQSPDQLTSLCQEIHALRNPPLLIAVDHEGGRVQRFRTGFQVLPAMGQLGELYDDDPDEAIRLAELFAWMMAAELRHYGVDLSFAPVLDVGGPYSDVIGNRAFHHDPGVIGHLANAWIRGMHEAGMQAVGKHFPGHGSVSGDSHHMLPIDQRALHEIESLDLLPFQDVMGAPLGGIMMAHVVYAQVDQLPAGYSQYWIETVLRGKLKFDGVVFSDDLNMAGAGLVEVGLAGEFAARAQRALSAGCDVLLICNNSAGADEVLEALGDCLIPSARLCLSQFQGGESDADLMSSSRWRKACDELERFQRLTRPRQGGDIV